MAGGPITAEQLTVRLDRIVDSARATGLSVLMLRGGEPVYEHYFGTKDQRSEAAADAETVSYAASLTKPLAAYLFLWLVD